MRADTTNIAEITNICITVSGNTKKQQRTLPVRSTILSTYLIGIVGAGDQTEESCQRVRRWIRDFPHLEQIHKTTYAPMIYTALCIMLLMRAASITWASGKGLGPGNLAPGRINHRCIGGFMYKNPRVTLNGYLREVGPYHPSSAVK